MRTRNRSSHLLVLTVSILLSCCGCSHGSGSSADNPAEPPTAEVTLVRVARADISESLTLAGMIGALPNQDVRVSSLVAGRITELRVAEGDRVTAGQLLAKIDDRPYREQLKQAEGFTAQTRANLENARLTRTRNEDLFSRGIAARKEVEDARTQETNAEASVRQAEAALALARLQVSRTEVRSPLTGTVVKRSLSVGEQVDGTAAQPVLEVANLAQTELFANVPEIYLGKIRVGQTLPISSHAFPGRTLTGRVVAVSSAVDPATNVGLIRIRIANSERLLRLGMFLSAQIPIETHPNALSVPPQAIYRDQEGQPHVYRVVGTSAAAIPVQLGLTTSDRVELLSGVREGETVILTGGYGLGDKAKVTVKGQSRP